MSSSKEIRTKIKSIKGIEKITHAMEMVAASKRRRAQDRMQASRPYEEKIRFVISHLAEGDLDYQHPFLEERTPRRVGFIVISTDRGLCGGLNNNLFKAVIEAMRGWHDQSVDMDIATIGKKAEHFFQRMGGNVVASIIDLGYKPGILDLIGTVKVMLDLYEKEKIDRIYIAYNRFVNTMVQKPVIELLLPVVHTVSATKPYTWDYLYEPDPKSLLNALLIRYVEFVVYQGVIENIASEQAARVFAMKNASDNAADLIDDLELVYNKARQAGITQELSEIVAGAAAV